MTEENTTATEVPAGLERAIGPCAAGCVGTVRSPLRDVEAMLREAGLRPTRQRVVLAELLFAQGDRHMTAEMLHSEGAQASLQVSLATVYNTLNLFARLGLLREIRRRWRHDLF